MIFRELWRDATELTRVAKGNTRLATVVGNLVTNSSWAITTITRFRSVARLLRVPGLNHALRVVQTAYHGVEIGNEVTLGHGVYFVHPLGVVIGGDARVGDRVRFMGNNTVGTAKENGYPTIEDDVVVGAGARILGPITVGARSIVGANAVVIADVPQDCVVAGVPARIIGEGSGYGP